VKPPRSSGANARQDSWTVPEAGEEKPSMIVGLRGGAVGVSAKMWGYSPTRRDQLRTHTCAAARARRFGPEPAPSRSAPQLGAKAAAETPATIARRDHRRVHGSPPPAGARDSLSSERLRIVTPMFTERAASRCAQRQHIFPGSNSFNGRLTQNWVTSPTRPPRSMVFHGWSFRASIARHPHCVLLNRAAVLLTRDTRPSDDCGRRWSCPAPAGGDERPQISRAISAKHPKTHGGTSRHDRC
jgi:hypothetical protein